MLKIKKVNYDEDFEYGCETCDWGSSYVNEIEIIFEDDTYTNIKIDRMYKYALTESDYMQLIANSNNIDEFCVNIIKKLKSKAYKHINSLNDEVEILEENKIPEKLNNFTISVGRVDDSNIEEYIQKLFEQQYEIFNKINSIIDYLKAKEIICEKRNKTL